MFTVASSLSLPVPLVRVWRLLADVERYHDWHPRTDFVSHPFDPKRLFYSYARPGDASPVFSADAVIVRLDRPTDLAWRVGIKGVLEFEEAFHLERIGHDTEITHRLSCRGAGSWLAFPLLRWPLRRFLASSDAALANHLRRATTAARYSKHGGSSH
jgi:hypothetical protein